MFQPGCNIQKSTSTDQCCVENVCETFSYSKGTVVSEALDEWLCIWEAWDVDVETRSRKKEMPGEKYIKEVLMPKPEINDGIESHSMGFHLKYTRGLIA